MLGVQGASAEEFHSRCMANSHVLQRRSREFAAVRDVVPAVLTMWAADVAMIEAVLWERIVMASSTPLREFFGAAEAFTAATSAHVVPLEDSATAAEIIQAVRAGARSGLPTEVVDAIDDTWPDIAFLRTLPAPRQPDFATYVSSSMGGRSPAGFVAAQRQEASARMNDAHSARVRGDVASAIEMAFDADFHSLEAYLVESAEAAGDVAHGTVVSRYTLASAAVSEIPALPSDFAAAVAVLRTSMTDALGAADGDRLRQVLEAV